jgi:hypothetical protein
LGSTLSASFAVLDLLRGRTAAAVVEFALGAAWAAVEIREVLAARRRPEAAFA